MKLAAMLAMLLLLPLSATDRRKGIYVGFSDSVLPHIADGNGWKTLITLANMDSKIVQYTLTFRSSPTGQPWQLNIAGFGAITTISGTIPIGGSAFFETTNPPGPTSVGWAQLETYDRIGGMAVFRFSPGGLQDTEAVVPFASEYDDDFLIPFDNRSGFVTSMAIVNPSSYTAVSVFVEFRDVTGQRILLDTITLQPREHRAFSTAERFPASIEKNGVIAFSTADLGVSALGIRFNPRFSFTSVHALSK
ncbi:MAG TPA: hypothetical protein VLE22_10485 [Bryobacteraceae bacterium]|nr:hypothetical protein [Bryobacteraceae bacterium]